MSWGVLRLHGLRVFTLLRWVGHGELSSGVELRAGALQAREHPFPRILVICCEPLNQSPRSCPQRVPSFSEFASPSNKANEIVFAENTAYIVLYCMIFS